MNPEEFVVRLEVTPARSGSSWMEFANDVAKAWAEYPLRWDFGGWTHQTDVACTQEERDMIHEYGVGRGELGKL